MNFSQRYATLIIRRLQEKQKKKERMVSKEGLKQACEGFLRAQISFCKRYLLESDTEGLRFYFFLSFFKKPCTWEVAKAEQKV